MQAKIACEHIIIRIEGWITINLRTCMSCKANEEIRFAGHEVKDQRVVHVYEKYIVITIF